MLALSLRPGRRLASDLFGFNELSERIRHLDVNPPSRTRHMAARI